MELDPLSLLQLLEMFPDEGACEAWWLRIRWPDGIVCPSCGTIGESRRIQTRRGKLQCSCAAQFSMFRQTPLNYSKLKLRVWLIALYVMVSGSKSVSERRLAEHLGVCIKTGWYLRRRIQKMMDENDPLLAQIVAADEVYCGGKPRPENRAPPEPEAAPLCAAAGVDDRPPAGPQRGDEPPPRPRKKARRAKIAILSLAGRGTKGQPGRVAARVIAAPTQAEIAPHRAALVDPGATLMTDDSAVYPALGRGYAGHLSVNHSQGESARKDRASGRTVHNNTCESFHSLLKRNHSGIWHGFSHPHAQAFVSEVAFRWN
jgi:ISXO2-like transposase domain/Transposase zinc-ribbon domain